MRGREEAELGMVPADQRFDTDDVLRADLDDRLEVEDELLLTESFPQKIFQGQPLQGPGIHGRRVELVVVATGVLGPIHRRVGVAHQRLRIGAVVRIDSDADAGGDEELAFADDEGNLQRLQNFLGDLGCVLHLIDPRNEQRELVTAKAGHGVAFAHAAADPLRDRLEQRVAHRVAERIVDVLEAIEVEKENGEPLVAAAGLSQGQDQTVHV